MPVVELPAKGSNIQALGLVEANINRVKTCKGNLLKMITLEFVYLKK